MGPVYKLSLPETLQGGRYKLSRDLTENTERDRPRGTDFADQLQAKAGLYTASGPAAEGAEGGGDEFIFQGLSSTEPDPTFPRYGMLDGMTDDPGVRVAVARRLFTLEGGKLACEVHRNSAQGDGQRTFPMCSWIDPHTQGIVMDSSPATQGMDPAEVDLKAFARKTAKVRDEVRVPAG
ncbi:hypothetical protein DVA86_13015 [Streptomyces armeniacus]|uniref:Uncharacterized protein n=2 Tax=Streptomyces armeniacus TaxID=83291 RepID=A0A345XP72_9ACTN|nr:hypothetical protein DVA86_13015 [Streptomyces armeniacus]